MATVLFNLGYLVQSRLPYEALCKSLAFTTLSQGNPLRALQAKREASSHCSSLHLGVACSALREITFNLRVHCVTLRIITIKAETCLCNVAVVHSKTKINKLTE